MTRIRVVPVLLLAQHGMVKTERFARSRYLGDPINAVKIFNEKMADELILLDIEATAKRRIDFEWLEDIVSEAFMPIAYGGGVDYRLTRRFTIRCFDFEYQQWHVTPTLCPLGGSVGVSYKIF